MKLPNKFTVGRFFLTFLIIALLLFPFDATGFNMPQLFVNEAIVIDIRYLIVGILFLVMAIVDFMDAFVLKKSNKTTEFEKMADTIAGKILVDSVLIILASQGFVHPIIPVIIIGRDIIVNSIKTAASSEGKVIATVPIGKAKTACLMIGITLTLFYNLPFELFNLRVADFLLILAAVLSIISGIQYYNKYKNSFAEKQLIS